MTNATHISEPIGFSTEITAYDQLPPRIRNAVANSAFSISSKMILNLYNMLKNEKMCLKAIEQIEEQFRNGVL